MLGDGRAILIGEHLSKNNERFDVQFKGSGITAFSRNGDGKAALGPMLREYIISEAMHSLKIPTTRSLAVVKTDEDIVRENIFDNISLSIFEKSKSKSFARSLFKINISGDFTGIGEVSSLNISGSFE